MHAHILQIDIVWIADSGHNRKVFVDQHFCSHHFLVISQTVIMSMAKVRLRVQMKAGIENRV